jgi:hypothetical protein
VGQSWLTRDNSIAFIYSTTNPDSIYPILARVYEAVKAAETNDYIRRDLSSTADFHRVTYTPEGYWIDGSEHPIDLITLVSEAGAAATPVAGDAVKPELRVGQVWRDRTGATHTITRDDNTEGHPLLCSNQCWYARDGRSIIHDMSPEIELVELVHDTDEPAEPTTTDANTPTTAYVIAISHGPDVVSRVLADGSAWYAPTHHGIPTGPWTRYAD